MNDNTRAVSVAETEVLHALLEQAARLSQIWLGQGATRPQLEAAALLAERLMILLGEMAEDWRHAHSHKATSLTELEGEGYGGLPSLILQTSRRHVTVDLAGLVGTLAAGSGETFNGVLMALLAVSETHAAEEFGSFASSAAVRLVRLWGYEVQGWLSDEQTTCLPLQSSRSLH
ncbi:hypothetical protein [Deinococcus sp.]|uniref:hypothetical protein n=1 Tax=Deinococcus sp. TaxID=47478 RepID=UPI003C7B4B3A